MLSFQIHQYVGWAVEYHCKFLHLTELGYSIEIFLKEADMELVAGDTTQVK